MKNAATIKVMTPIAISGQGHVGMGGQGDGGLGGQGEGGIGGQGHGGFGITVIANHSQSHRGVSHRNRR